MFRNFAYLAAPRDLNKSIAGAKSFTKVASRRSSGTKEAKFNKRQAIGKQTHATMS